MWSIYGQGIGALWTPLISMVRGICSRMLECLYMEHKHYRLSGYGNGSIEKGLRQSDVITRWLDARP